MKTITSKHTPGPWTLQYRQSIFTIAGGGDEFGGCHLVATVNHDVDHRTGENNPNATGDARLIAAAPAMLEALEEIALVAHNRSRVNMRDGTSLLLFARAAIAKAKGEA